MPGRRNMSVLLAIHLLWSCCALPLVTRQHRIPSSAAAWAAIILLLPVAGTLLYLLAGYQRRTPVPRRSDPPADPVGKLVFHGCGTRPTPCNRVEPLHNGNNAFSALIASLQHATRTIHMEYYIFRDDRIGRTIAEILIRKSRAGVEVRVIYDAVGSWRLSRRMLRRMHEAGIRTAAYAPLRFPWFRPSTTRRNHRKIVVTDGKVSALKCVVLACSPLKLQRVSDFKITFFMVSYIYLLNNSIALSASMTINRPRCEIALSIFPLALMRLAVLILQLKMRAIPAMPYSRRRSFGASCVGFPDADSISSRSCPTVKSINLVFGSISIIIRRNHLRESELL